MIRTHTILAQDWGELLEPIRRGVRGDDETGLLAFVAVVLVTVVAFMAIRHYRRRHPSVNEPSTPAEHSLFDRLSRAHGLDRGQNRLLLDLARQENLPEPAELFVSPAAFDRAARALAAEGSPLDPEKLNRLRGTVYGETV
jgi:hypothetical protein